MNWNLVQTDSRVPVSPNELQEGEVFCSECHNLFFMVLGNERYLDLVESEVVDESYLMDWIGDRVFVQEAQLVIGENSPGNPY